MTNSQTLQRTILMLFCWLCASSTGLLLSGTPVSGQVTRVVERQTSFADLSTTDAAGNLLVTGDLLTNASSDVPFPFSQNNDLLARRKKKSKIQARFRPNKSP